MYSHSCMHTNTHAHTHTLTCVHTYVHTWTYTHACTHTCTHMDIHTHTQICITQAYTHARTHTHLYAQTQLHVCTHRLINTVMYRTPAGIVCRHPSKRGLCAVCWYYWYRIILLHVDDPLALRKYFIRY